MGNLGCGCSALAVLAAIVTAIPLLGWGNWFFTLPLAVSAIVISIIGLMKGEQRIAAILGLVTGIGIIFWALFRLLIGGFAA